MGFSVHSLPWLLLAWVLDPFVWSLAGRREAQAWVEARAFESFTLLLRVTSSLVLGEQGGEAVGDVSTCLGQVALFHCLCPATLMPSEDLPAAAPIQSHKFHGGRTSV